MNYEDRDDYQAATRRTLDNYEAVGIAIIVAWLAACAIILAC